MIAQRITNVSGASEVFGYGFVTYWEQAKAKLVGVDPAVIAQYNVVSAPVAAQMALGAAQAAGADIGISVTGVAGPTGGDAVRPVGTVYLGAARGDTVYVEKLFVSRPDRALIRCPRRAGSTGAGPAAGAGQGACRHKAAGRRRLPRCSRAGGPERRLSRRIIRSPADRGGEELEL